MNILTVNELDQVLSLAIKSKCPQESVNHIKRFITTVRKIPGEARALNEEEIKILSSNKRVKFIMIVFFLTKNTSLEFLRREGVSYNGESVPVKKSGETSKKYSKEKYFYLEK